MAEKKKLGRPKVGVGNGKKIGRMGPHHREKIAKSKILARAIAHAEGTLDPSKVKGPHAPMTASQVAMATTLLKKVMPDMTQSEVSLEADVQSTIAKINIVGVEVDPKDLEETTD